VIPAMLLVGIGGGVAFNPLLFAALADVAPNETGLASGVTNTASLLGGALGLAVIASLAAAVSRGSAASDIPHVAALCDGYRAALLAGAACVGIAATIAAVFLRQGLRAANRDLAAT
jgi:hypothetical protein